ncbi:MAG: hypothetical protein J1F38_10875, partial [Muribaculaceae bacterium]|nr:hypothetical protein [Muribaculaceae bacterium]
AKPDLDAEGKMIDSNTKKIYQINVGTYDLCVPYFLECSSTSYTLFLFSFYRFPCLFTGFLRQIKWHI